MTGMSLNFVLLKDKSGVNPDLILFSKMYYDSP